jgi:alkanesulfonate monooxygenase SsuD/methylene tetrahydromethanopterin reductase-like flavin-dependent oxidoreductase (luciferase family)
VRASVFLPDRHDWPSLLRAAREAEAAGFDRVLLPDHLDFGPPQLEAWTALTALAAATSRIGLGFGVLSATFRPPGLLARMADALDQVSGGRLWLGLGAGIDPAEHERFGLPFPSPGRRVALLEECCASLRRLCERPLRLVIGASGDRALEVVARHADEWNCGAIYLDRAAERLARLDGLAERPIARSVNVPVTVGALPDTERARRYNLHHGLHGSPEQMLERCAELRRLGFQSVWLFAQDRAAFDCSLELLPRLREL